MEHKDIVNETIDKIQVALDEYDALRESRIKFEEPCDRYDTNINGTRESLEEYSVKVKRPDNKTTILIKENMMEQNNINKERPTTRIDEINQMFDDELNKYVNLNNELQDILNRLTGESLDCKTKSDEETLTSINILNQYSDRVLWLNSEVKKTGEIINILNNYV